MYNKTKSVVQFTCNKDKSLNQKFTVNLDKRGFQVIYYTNTLCI